MNKTAKRNHFKTILNKGLSQSLYNERYNDYIELVELFKNHPEYPNKLRELKDICIVRNKRTPKYYEFNLIRTDGTREDISYIECISPSNKSLNEALRYCVQPQIDHFRDNNIMKCKFCNKTSRTEEIQVDHITMFKVLTTDFLKNKKHIPTEFDSSYFNGAMFKDDDKMFANEWYEYHLNNAELRPLCKTCNLTRPKKMKN